MKLLIDHLNNITGWTINSPSTITLNDYTDFIAGFNTASLKIFFSHLDTTRKAIKTFLTPYDVSNYETLIFSIWSRDKGKQEYKKFTDFNYKLTINGTDSYYLPVYEKFTHVEIGIENVTQITKIEIQPLHSDDDYIIISEMIVEKEEIPLDILNGTIETIGNIITTDYLNGINVGTVASATAGDTSITIAGTREFLERYSVVKIKDSTYEELIQLGDNDNVTFQIIPYLGSNGMLQYSYTNAIVYLQFPVYKNPNQTDIRLPGIALWGIESEPVYKKVELRTETYRNNSSDFLERIKGQVLNFPILISCEAHHAELIDKMSRIIRKFIARSKLWINGRMHDIEFNGNAREIRPQEGIDIIHKVQYNCLVELEENIFDRVIVKNTTNQIVTVNIEEQ